jgi:Ca2+-binding EF-hand superfamily protein
MSNNAFTLALLALLSAACQSAHGIRSSSAGRPAPMDLTGRAASSWDYLCSKYDGDGDGRIAPGEYGREPEHFTRLDRDADGFLSASDFADGGQDSMGEYVREQRALRVLANHFQADDEDRELRLDELEWMVTAYDADQDGALDEGEFELGAAEHRREVVFEDPSGTVRVMLGDYEPWEALLAAIDEDRDGRLAAAELTEYFRLRSSGDEVWNLMEAAEEELVSDTTGVPMGEPAPDFLLEPLHGGERVSLSSFRGKAPVALIFGSYT